MQARRGKSIIMVGTKTFARMTEEQFAVTLLEKEHEHKKLLKQQEDELHQRSKEEMNAKIRDIELKHKVALQQRDHKMALQAKELQIKELELIEAKMRQETTAVHHHEYPATQLGLPRPAYTAPSFNYATGFRSSYGTNTGWNGYTSNTYGQNGWNGARVQPGEVTLQKLVVHKSINGSKLRIIDRAKHKWKEITSLICSDPNKISALEKQYNSNPDDCLREVLIKCFIENKPQNYSQDWRGLIEVLDDVGLEALAEDVRKCLRSLQGRGMYAW